jgi:hypothetical protein
MEGLVYSVDLLIHTNAAKSLVTGFKDEENNLKSQIGLLTFSKKLKHVCIESLNDNPLADAVLIHLESNMSVLHQDLQDAIADSRESVVQKLKSRSAVFSTALGVEGHRFSLRFKYPYAIEMVKLVNYFDALCVTLMVMHRESLLTREAVFKIKRRYARQFRSIVKLIETWDSRIVFRRKQLDSLSERQKKKLIEYKGSRNIEITEDILNKTYVPQWLKAYSSSAGTTVNL